MPHGSDMGLEGYLESIMGLDSSLEHVLAEMFSIAIVQA